MGNIINTNIRKLVLPLLTFCLIPFAYGKVLFSVIQKGALPFISSNVQLSLSVENGDFIVQYSNKTNPEKKVQQGFVLGLWPTTDEQHMTQPLQADLVYLSLKTAQLTPYHFQFETEDQQQKAMEAVNLQLFSKETATPLENLTFAVVVNPHSGKEAGQKTADALIPKLKNLGAEIKPFTTSKDDTLLYSFLQNTAAQCDAIIIIGGDGTLKAAVEGVITASCLSVPFAFIPRGTGNGIACSLDTDNPAKALLAMLHALQKQQNRKIHVKQYTAEWQWGRQTPEHTQKGYLLLDATTGLVSDIDINSEKFGRIGSLRLELGAAIELLKLQNHELTLTTDDTEHARGNYTHAVAMNAPYAAKNVKLAPSARPETETLELVTVMRDGLGRTEAVPLFLKTKDGSYTESEKVHTVTVSSKLIIESHQQDNLFVVDGELLTHNGQNPSKLTIEPSEHYVTFLVPEPLP